MKSDVNDRTQLWTNEFLDRMQQTADPLADETVQALFDSGGIAAVNALWNHLLANEEILPPNKPVELEVYLTKAGAFPPWMDQKLVSQGEDFFERHGLYCLISLLCAGLPECYALKNEAVVLGTTKQLETHVYRRVIETAQLVVAVMRRNGLRDGGGLKAALKVRLMHAAIRHLIIKTASGNTGERPRTFVHAVAAMPAWDVAKAGQPINQELIAYTLLTFSFVILRALDELRIPVNDDERTAFLHCWNVVGALMGVRMELLAFTFEESQILFSKIKERHMIATDDGKHLARALLIGSRKIISRETDSLLPRLIAKRLPAVIMRLLVDGKTRKVLRVPWLGPAEGLLLCLFRLFIRISVPAYQWLLSFGRTRFGIAIVLQLTRIPRGNRPLFAIPEHLAVAWKIKPEGDNVSRPQPIIG